MISMLLGLFMISFALAVSFDSKATQLLYDGTTVVMGTAYSQDYSQKIGGADITVQCSHNGTINEQTTTTASSGDEIGDYLVSFTNDLCTGGDSVTVIAVKGDLSGTATERVVENAILGLDVAVVNVPMTPEFGAILGLATLLGAVGIFFIVRKN